MIQLFHQGINQLLKPSNQMATKLHTSENGMSTVHLQGGVIIEIPQYPEITDSGLIIGRGMNAAMITINHHTI